MSLRKIRLALIFLFVGIGIIMHVSIGFRPAWYYYLAAAFLTATHFLFGNVWQAFSQLRKGNLLQAELMIKKNKYPNMLLRSPQAYYHFTLGMVELKKEEIAPAERHLQKALDLGLRTPNDNALTALNLAHIALLKNDRKAGIAYAEKARDFQPTDLMIKENVKKILPPARR